MRSLSDALWLVYESIFDVAADWLSAAFFTLVLRHLALEVAFTATRLASAISQPAWLDFVLGFSLRRWSDENWSRV
jgi:hypothetical protein